MLAEAPVGNGAPLPRFSGGVGRRSGGSTYFERGRGGRTDPGAAAAAAAAAWVWLCAWWHSLAPACVGSLGVAGSQSPVSQSGLISQMQRIHSLDEGKEREEGGMGERKRERGSE